jgi:TM2 domain-containing membrane protein YozV
VTIPQYQDPYEDPYAVQWSDKSKIVAGLLQIIPGFLMGLGGIGRLYAGHTMLGIVQLAATVLGWISFWCGFALVLPFFVFAAMWIWFVIDGVILLAGRPVDGQGRLLRS